MADTINSFSIGYHFYAGDFQLLTHMGLLTEFHNIVDDWSFASSTLQNGAHLEDFS